MEIGLPRSIKRSGFGALGLAVALAVASESRAVDLGFVEDFSSGNAGFTLGDGSAPTLSTTGGPTGGAFISSEVTLIAGTGGFPPTIFRAPPGNTSNGAFFGNWIAEGVSGFSFDVRHNASVPVNFTFRAAPATNFPGGSATTFTPVAPGQWQTLTFDIDPNNPQFVSFSGTSFESVFTDIGRIQFGLNPTGTSETFTFDLTNITVIPEPASAMALVLGSALLMPRRRNQRGR